MPGGREAQLPTLGLQHQAPSGVLCVHNNLTELQKVQIRYITATFELLHEFLHVGSNHGIRYSLATQLTHSDYIMRNINCASIHNFGAQLELPRRWLELKKRHNSIRRRNKGA